MGVMCRLFVNHRRCKANKHQTDRNAIISQQTLTSEYSIAWSKTGEVFPIAAMDNRKSFRRAHVVSAELISTG